MSRLQGEYVVSALAKAIDDSEEAVSRMADMAIEQIEAKPGKQRVRDDLIRL